MRVTKHHHIAFLSFRSALLILLIGLSLSTTAAALEFKFQRMDGGIQNLSDFRGKWVLVNFWASWCTPCLKEIPDLVRFHEKHKDRDAIVLGVNYGEALSDKALHSFITKFKITYPVIRTNPEIEHKLGVAGAMPTSYLINPSGKIAAWVEGPVTARQIEDFILGQSQ